MKLLGVFGVPAIHQETGKEYIQPIPNVVVVLRTEKGVEHTFEVDSFGAYITNVPIGEYNVQAYVKGNKQTLGYLRQGVHFPVTEATELGAFDEWLKIDTVNTPDPLLAQWTQLLKDIEKQRTLFANNINDVVGVIERDSELAIKKAIARVQKEADAVKVEANEIVSKTQSDMDTYLVGKKAEYDKDLANNIATSNSHLSKVTVIKTDIEKIQKDINTANAKAVTDLASEYSKHSKALTTETNNHKKTLTSHTDTLKVVLTEHSESLKQSTVAEVEATIVTNTNISKEIQGYLTEGKALNSTIKKTGETAVSNIKQETAYRLEEAKEGINYATRDAVGRIDTVTNTSVKEVIDESNKLQETIITNKTSVEEITKAVEDANLELSQAINKVLKEEFYPLKDEAVLAIKQEGAKSLEEFTKNTSTEANKIIFSTSTEIEVSSRYFVNSAISELNATLETNKSALNSEKDKHISSIESAEKKAVQTVKDTAVGMKLVSQDYVDTSIKSTKEDLLKKVENAQATANNAIPNSMKTNSLGLSDDLVPTQSLLYKVNNQALSARNLASTKQNKLSFIGNGNTVNESAVSSSIEKGYLGEKDLNDVLENGVYYQVIRANTTKERNYPENTNGVLEVVKLTNNWINQSYSTWINGANKIFIRSIDLSQPKGSQYNAWVCLPNEEYNNNKYVDARATKMIQGDFHWDYFSSIINASTVSYAARIFQRRNGKAVNLLMWETINGKVRAWFGTFDANGAWVKDYHIYTTANTTVDTNGFIKAASPIVKLFDDHIEYNDDFIEPPVFEKLATGTYKISNTLGLADEGWTFEKPRGKDGSHYFRILVKKLEDGCIITVHDEYESVVEDTIKDVDGIERKINKIEKILGEARDIKPNERWIDLRFNEPMEIEVTAFNSSYDLVSDEELEEEEYQ